MRQACMDGDIESLNLVVETEPGQDDVTGIPTPIILPDLPEGNLLLSLGSDAALDTSSSGASGERGTSGVMWTVSASSVSSSEELDKGVMDWTVFPSTGMLLPGQR